MSVPSTPQPASRSRVVIDAPRLWGGGVATALVAALVAAVGVLICRDVLDIKLVEPPMLSVTKYRPRTSRTTYRHAPPPPQLPWHIFFP